MTIELLAFYPAKQGANWWGQVDFAYTPAKLAPVKITRDYNKGSQDKPDWQTAVVAEIDGGTVVRVKGAFCKTSKDDKAYLQCQGVEVPYEVTREILRLAVIEFNKRNK